MKFAVDAMLGTLAKWLRILGYDAHYDQSLSDHQLVRVARAEGRAVLTRDRELARRRGLHVVLITAEDLDGQLRQVVGEFQLELDRSSSRCPVCNILLEPMDQQAAHSRVPDYVAETHQTFAHCPACGRIYWRGTHWQHMEERLTKLQYPARTSTQAMEENPGTD